MTRSPRRARPPAPHRALHLALPLLLALLGGLRVAHAHPETPLRPQALAVVPGAPASAAPGETLRWPVVRSGRPAAAWRINQWLALTVLERLLPDPLPGRWRLADSEGTAPVALDFSVRRDDGRLLSLALHGEACGAYCETYTQFHSFDAHTGRHLRASDLLNAAGLERVRRRVAAERSARIRAAIAALSPGRSAEADDDAALMISVFRECEAALWQSALDRDDLLIGLRGQLHFLRGRCSNHAMRALDELGDFDTSVPLQAVHGQLTAYGRSLLLGGPAHAEPNSLADQVLPGRIGTRAIALRLQPAAQAADLWRGEYRDLRHDRPVALEGRLDGGVLRLAELDDQSRPRATLTLSPHGTGWTGHWQGRDRRWPASLGH